MTFTSYHLKHRAFGWYCSFSFFIFSIFYLFNWGLFVPFRLSLCRARPNETIIKSPAVSELTHFIPVCIRMKPGRSYTNEAVCLKQSLSLEQWHFYFVTMKADTFHFEIRKHERQWLKQRTHSKITKQISWNCRFCTWNLTKFWILTFSV